MFVFGDRPFIKRMYMTLCCGLLLLLMTGCQKGQAPREFAPDGTVIEQAMKMELRQYYRGLSQTLAAPPPDLDLKNIQVNQLDSFFLKGLPVYHVQGTYDLELTLPTQTETRKRNHFDLHLQRQTEGKTWRSLKQVAAGWQSFAIRE